MSEYEAAMSADEVGAGEHAPATLTQKQLNDDVLKMISWPGWLWWMVFILDLAVLAVGFLALRNQIVLGLGVAGYTRPVMWAAYITNFVFWVAIAAKKMYAP